MFEKNYRASSIIAAIALSGCAAVSQPVYKVPENNNCTKEGIEKKQCSKFDGVPYVLPRTKVKLTIPVVATTKTEGGIVSSAREIYANNNTCSWDKEDKTKSHCDNNNFKQGFGENVACVKHVYTYADELGIMINLIEPDGDAEVSHKLGDISITSEAEPDPDQLYFVEVKGKLFERRSLDITFAAGGILSEITSSKEDKTAEFAAKTFGSILGLVTKFGSYEPQGMPAGIDLNKVKNDCSKNDYKNLVVRALGALDYIKNFPITRNKELTGQANNAANTKENLEFRLKELDASHDAAMALFEGSEKEKTKNYEITMLPQPQSAGAKGDNEVELATFSKACGLNRLNSQPTEKVPFTNAPSYKDGCKDAPKLKAIISSPPQMKTLLSERVNNSLDSSANIRGIYYRVPEVTRISISENKKEGQKELLAKDVPLAQFGKVASLPAQTGSSNVTYKVTLDPVTGMLLKVNISSEAANTGMAKDFIDPVGDYLKARKDSNDELTKLQREEALLKTQKSIKDLKEALGQ